MFLASGHRRFRLLCTLVVFGALSLWLNLDPTMSGDPWRIVMDVLMAAWGLFSVSELFVERLLISEAGIEMRNSLNKPRFQLAWDEIERYDSPFPGRWRWVANGMGYAVSPIDAQQIHWVMAEYAPRALHAKLWRSGQIPPQEDFLGLSMFHWKTALLGVNSVGLVLSIFLFSAVKMRALGLAPLFLPELYVLKDLFRNLSITSEGVRLESLTGAKQIGWEELSAIFCEKDPSGLSYFVLAAPGRTILVPTHVLSDPEVRRKFFYSIPDYTRFVNADKFRFRSAGKRKVRGAEEAPGAHETVFGI